MKPSSDAAKRELLNLASQVVTGRISRDQAKTAVSEMISSAVRDQKERIAAINTQAKPWLDNE